MKTITLQIETARARDLHKTASPELKSILESSAPKGFFSGDITERIKSYEDACEETGEKCYTDDELGQMYPGRPDRVAEHKLEVITAALNEGEAMDMLNTSQNKYWPWFDISAGFVFYATSWTHATAHAGYASRLCFKNEKLAAYSMQAFFPC